MSKKKQVNKILVGIFLWTALGSIWALSRTKKWKKFFTVIKNDIKNWFKEMKSTFEKLKNKYAKKKK